MEDAALLQLMYGTHRDGLVVVGESQAWDATNYPRGGRQQSRGGLVVLDGEYRLIVDLIDGLPFAPRADLRPLQSVPGVSEESPIEVYKYRGCWYMHYQLGERRRFLRVMKPIRHDSGAGGRVYDSPPRDAPVVIKKDGFCVYPVPVPATSFTLLLCRSGQPLGLVASGTLSRTSYEAVNGDLIAHGSSFHGGGTIEGVLVRNPDGSLTKHKAGVGVTTGGTHPGVYGHMIKESIGSDGQVSNSMHILGAGYPSGFGRQGSHATRYYFSGTGHDPRSLTGGRRDGDYPRVLISASQRPLTSNTDWIGVILEHWNFCPLLFSRAEATSHPPFLRIPKPETFTASGVGDREPERRVSIVHGGETRWCGSALADLCARHPSWSFRLEYAHGAPSLGDGLQWPRWYLFLSGRENARGYVFGSSVLLYGCSESFARNVVYSIFAHTFKRAGKPVPAGEVRDDPLGGPGCGPILCSTGDGDLRVSQQPVADVSPRVDDEGRSWFEISGGWSVANVTVTEGASPRVSRPAQVISGGQVSVIRRPPPVTGGVPGFLYVRTIWNDYFSPFPKLNRVPGSIARGERGGKVAFSDFIRTEGMTLEATAYARDIRELKEATYERGLPYGRLPINWRSSGVYLTTRLLE